MPNIRMFNPPSDKDPRRKRPGGTGGTLFDYEVMIHSKNTFRCHYEILGSGSMLYGMPPIPQMGSSTPPFQTTKKTADESSPNIFAGALTKTDASKPTNIFAKPSAPPSQTSLSNPFGPPAQLFSKPPEKSDIFKTIPAQHDAKKVATGSIESTAPKSVFPVMRPAENPFTKPPSSSTSTTFKSFLKSPSSTASNPFAKAQETAKPKEMTSENIFQTSGENAGQKVQIKNPFGVSTGVDSSNIFGKPASSVQKPASEGILNPFAKKPQSSNIALFKGAQDENQPKFTISTALKSRLGTRQSEPTREEKEGEENQEEDQSENPENNPPRLTSKEDLKAIKSVICEEIPQQALNKKVLERHFSKFGKVVRISLSAKNSSATVYYTDHKSAHKAKEKGHLINPQIPRIGAIFYHRIKKSSERTEIDDELASMSETAPEEFKMPTSVISRPILRPTMPQPPRTSIFRQATQPKVLSQPPPKQQTAPSEESSQSIGKIHKCT